MINFIYHKTLPSTQIKAIEIVRDGEVISNTAIFTQIQTNGIGRSGSEWISKAGNLSMSVVFVNIKDGLPYSILSAIAVADIFEEYGIKVSIKWPNDLFINGKKCGGIITNIEKYEGVSYCIVGIGVNLLFSPESINTSYQATNVLDETGINLIPEEIAKQVAQKIELYILDSSKIDIIKKFNSRAFGLGDRVSSYFGESGNFIGIDALGNALIEDGKIYKISSGSINFFKT